MMTFRIYHGFEDYIVLQGETIEEIREQANVESNERGWKQEDLWSEQLD